jgi:hypothetical protein
MASNFVCIPANILICSNLGVSYRVLEESGVYYCFMS